MIRLSTAHVQPIGLDIGFDSIKMLQLEATGGGLSVHAAARMPIPVEMRQSPELRMPGAIDLIRQMFRQNPFSGRRIVTSLPRELVHVKNLRLPNMPALELSSAIEFEARSIFAFDTDAAQVRFLHAGEVRQGNDARQEVIVLAAKNEDVENYLEQLHCSGAQVDSLDWEPAAIYRAVERFIRRREDEHEVHVLIEIGRRATQVIIGKGRDISFYKPIEIGGQKFNEAVSRKLSISMDEATALRRRLVESSDEASTRDPVRQAVCDATRSIMEELAREISLCLRYYSVTFRGQRPNRTRLTGGEANDAQLQTILNSQLPIPSEAGRLMQSVTLSKLKPADRRGALSEWTVALGLGLKMTTGNFGSRDGTARAVATARAAQVSSNAQAEVVELNGALGPSPNPTQNAAPTVIEIPPTGEEALHA